tara:strand:+ start:2660 stop:3736 length:1077 start_codon:yes stop_codon:yes gene_type:complete
MPNQSQQNLDPQLPHYFEDGIISITDVLLVLVRQLKVIIITPSIICSLTIIYVFFFTSPVYESSAKIMSSSGSGTTQALGVAAQFGINIPINQSEPQWVYPEIIKSRTLARAMLQRKFDTEKYGTQKPLLQILTYGDQEPTVGIDTLIKAGINRVIGMIDIQQNGSFYELTLSGFEALFVRDFATSLIEELDKHQREYNKAKTSKTRIFIEERLLSTQFELESAEEALKDFTDRNRRIENSPSLQLERQRLAREVSVLTGVFTTLKQQLETTKIEEVKESVYVVVLDPPEAPLWPSRPNKRFIVIIAGFIGIGIGIIIGFIKEYAENSGEDEKEKMSEVKLLLNKYISNIIPSRGLKE